MKIIYLVIVIEVFLNCLSKLKVILVKVVLWVIFEELVWELER